MKSDYPAQRICSGNKFRAVNKTIMIGVRNARVSMSNIYFIVINNTILITIKKNTCTSTLSKYLIFRFLCLFQSIALDGKRGGGGHVVMHECFYAYGFMSV